MNQANKIVDVLSEIVPTIYYDVFKDDFSVFMFGLWEKTDEKHPPILDQSVLQTGESIQALKNTNWDALPKEKKMEWLKRMDLQALLKALRFRNKPLELFCEKNSLVKGKMISVLQAMINWRNYGVGHKSIYKYEQMDEKVFKLNILEPVWEFTDLLSRYYGKECGKLRKILQKIEIGMKLPDTSISRLVALSNKSENTVREVLSILKVEVGQDGTIKGEDEKELVDSIKRLSKKDSVQKKKKEEEKEDDKKWIDFLKSHKKIIIAIAGIIILLLLIIILFSRCGSDESTETNKSTQEVKNDITTTEEPTTDNRKVVDIFSKLKIKEVKSKDAESEYSNDEETDSNSLPVDIKIINNSKEFPNLQFEVKDSYDNEEDYESEREYWDNDLKLAGEELDDVEEPTDAYGEKVDLSKGRVAGEILVIQVKQVSVDANKGVKFVNSEGKTYLLYTVKGLKIIKTYDESGKINFKSLKKACNKGKNKIKALADDFNKVLSTKMIGYYLTLPEENLENKSFIHIIYKVNLSSILTFGKKGINYCSVCIENPIYDSDKNMVYSIEEDEISFGGVETDSGSIGGTSIDGSTFFDSVKELYGAMIPDDDNDIYCFPYNNNKLIKKYD